MVIAGWVLIDVATGFDHRYGTWDDYQLYVGAARAWLAGQPFYHAYQLAGSYALFTQPYPVTYPPVALWLLVPFTVLPSFLWWVIPIGIAVLAWTRLRPAEWTWIPMLILLLWPVTPEEFINGNPVMWAWAAAWAGVVVPGPSAIALLKPTVAPFAIVGARHRNWWILLALGIAAAVPFGSMWVDYVQAMSNLRAPFVYVVRDWPMMAMPLVAWVGSRRAQLFARSLRKRAAGRVGIGALVGGEGFEPPTTSV